MHIKTHMPEAERFKWYNSQRRVVLTMAKKAEIIERIVANNEIAKDLAPVYRVSYSTILSIMDLYLRKPEVIFYAPGKVVLTLESKV